MSDGQLGSSWMNEPWPGGEGFTTTCPSCAKMFVPQKLCYQVMQPQQGCLPTRQERRLRASCWDRVTRGRGIGDQ